MHASAMRAIQAVIAGSADTHAAAIHYFHDEGRHTACAMALKNTSWSSATHFFTSGFSSRPGAQRRPMTQTADKQTTEKKHGTVILDHCRSRCRRFLKYDRWRNSRIDRHCDGRAIAQRQEAAEAIFVPHGSTFVTAAWLRM
jgi:hypothetical protein